MARIHERMCRAVSDMSCRPGSDVAPPHARIQPMPVGMIIELKKLCSFSGAIGRVKTAE
jgi:hypothetical protein